MTRNYSEHGVGSLTGQTPEVAGGQVFSAAQLKLRRAAGANRLAGRPLPAARRRHAAGRESSVEVLSSRRQKKRPSHQRRSF